MDAEFELIDRESEIRDLSIEEEKEYYRDIDDIMDFVFLGDRNSFNVDSEDEYYEED